MTSNLSGGAKVKEMNMELEDMYLLAGSEDLSRRYNALASNYSDFHKDFYGSRPRDIIGCADRFGSHDELVEGMSHLRRLMDGLKARFEALKARLAGGDA